MVVAAGLEPATSSMSRKRATNCAKRPERPKLRAGAQRGQGEVVLARVAISSSVIRYRVQPGSGFAPRLS